MGLEGNRASQNCRDNDHFPHWDSYWGGTTLPGWPQSADTRAQIGSLHVVPLAAHQSLGSGCNGLRRWHWQQQWRSWSTKLGDGTNRRNSTSCFFRKKGSGNQLRTSEFASTTWICRPKFIDIATYVNIQCPICIVGTPMYRCPGFIIILLIIAAIASIVVNATNEGSRWGTRKLGLMNGERNLGGSCSMNSSISLFMYVCMYVCMYVYYTTFHGIIAWNVHRPFDHWSDLAELLVLQMNSNSRGCLQLYFSGNYYMFGNQPPDIIKRWVYNTWLQGIKSVWGDLDEKPRVLPIPNWTALPKIDASQPEASGGSYKPSCTGIEYCRIL